MDDKFFKYSTNLFKWNVSWLQYLYNKHMANQN